MKPIPKNRKKNKCLLENHVIGGIHTAFFIFFLFLNSPLLGNSCMPEFFKKIKME